MAARWVTKAAWLVTLSTAVTGAVIGAGSCIDEEDPFVPPENIGTVQQAATGVCDANPPTSTQACIDAVQMSGGAIVNDVFTDSNGLTADQLPVFGQLFNNWPGCNTVNFSGCSGQSNAPFDCPGQYTCTGLPGTFANAETHLNALDRLWWHPCRLTNHNLIGNCPDWSSCTADGIGGNYLAWEGLVFDLGGPSNKVAIFAQNDHGPQPCESLEYTVYLTDNPLSQEQITDPIGTGVDPGKWNRAVLTTVFTKGFVEVRPPDPAGHAACGDTALYSVEEDSFVQVFSLPCGINFRYASIVAGNDGLDFPECAFDSQEAELDAVAGLTESGGGVCPDEDGDLFVDCMCVNAPPICDCNDADAAINPNAPEPCDSPDVNCDGNPGGCLSPLVCYDSICLPTCVDENAACPQGATCTNTVQGEICVPDDCSVAGCPDGSVCVDEQCVPECDGVVCPGDQICQDGQCLDPCKDIQCPPPLVCQNAQCVAPCNCFAGDVGCVDLPGTVCDDGNTDLCVDPACVGVMCPANETCDPLTGTCQPFCHSGVMCPAGQKCVAPDGCVPLCVDVTCDPGFSCNPDSGDCEDVSCQDVECFAPLVCVNGECVDMGNGGGGPGGNAAGGNGTGGAGAGPSLQGGDTEESGGCGCRVVRAHDDASGRWALLLLGLGLLGRRRSSRRVGESRLAR
jgi:MYXO-CTERM domain-containing protein